jgi:hypothetical protein
MATGNAWVEFRWNGTTYELPYSNVTSYEQKPVYAADGFTLDRYEVTLQGSCLIADGTNTYTDLALKFKTGTGRVDRFRVRVTSSGGTEDLIDVSYPDTMRGPFLSLTVTEISGRRACVVNFTANAALSFSEGQLAPDYPIISHRWTSSFRLDQTGTVTRTVSGVLTVDLAATGATTTIAASGSVAAVNNRAPWADLYRKAIAPAMSGPGYWRRESQTFAYSDAGNALIYEVVDSQARTALPDAAYAGTASFTYERNRQDLAFAMMRFSCTLEGEVNGDVRNLIWAAVVLAQTRIDFRRSRIDRMSVTEEEMLKKAQIRFEIDARAPAIGTDIPSMSQASVPLAQNVGKYFSVSRTCDWKPDEYGPGSLGVAGIPHWSGNNASAKPYNAGTLVVADVVSALVEGCTPGTPTTTFLGDATDFTQANNEIQAGPFGVGQANFTAEGNVASVERQMTTTTVNTVTRMHRLQTLYTEGSDFVFQTGKAAVELEETTTVRRLNEPPNRVFRPIPPGFIVIKDDWKVNHGDVDASGTRTFTGIYTRTLLSYDGGGSTSNGYSTVSGRRQWWSTSVAAPLTLGYSENDQLYASNVFALGATTQAYQTGTAQDYA